MWKVLGFCELRPTDLLRRDWSFYLTNEKKQIHCRQLKALVTCIRLFWSSLPVKGLGACELHESVFWRSLPVESVELL